MADSLRRAFWRGFIHGLSGRPVLPFVRWCWWRVAHRHDWTIARATLRAGQIESTTRRCETCGRVEFYSRPASFVVLRKGRPDFPIPAATKDTP